METINERAFWAEIHQDMRAGEPHVFSLKYVKKDSTVGYKSRVSKSKRALPGEQKYRGNVSQNRVLLLYNHENGQHFEVLADFIIEYDGKRIMRNY